MKLKYIVNSEVEITEQQFKILGLLLNSSQNEDLIDEQLEDDTELEDVPNDMEGPTLGFSKLDFQRLQELFPYPYKD